MQRFIAACVFATSVFVAGTASRSEHRRPGPSPIPGAGPRRRRRTRPRAPPRPAEAIDYDTIHLEKRLSAVRAIGAITLDGALDEPAWSEAPIASGFIQNDPREGSPATYDTEVRVLYTDDALYFGVFAHETTSRRRSSSAT